MQLRYRHDKNDDDDDEEENKNGEDFFFAKLFERALFISSPGILTNAIYLALFFY